MAAQTIALFGATGNSGRAVLSLALEMGYAVKAMVRTPSKVKIEHANLTLIQGDFTTTAKIKETVDGCDYVVSVAGGPMGKPSDYPKDLMINFVKCLMAAMKQTSTVKCFLYQAGFLAALPSEQKANSLPWGTWIARKTVARGLEPNLQDHEAVMRYIEDERGDSSFASIFYCPPVLKDGEAVRKLSPATKRSIGTDLGGVSFKELAGLTLHAIKDESLYGSHCFVTK